MSSIKRCRERAGLLQTNVVEALSQFDNRIDAPMLSKFESGVCLPSPTVAKLLAEIYGVTVAELFSDCELAFAKQLFFSSVPVEPVSFQVHDLVTALLDFPCGVRRAELVNALDVSMPKLKRTVTEARKCGYVIEYSKGAYRLVTEDAELERCMSKLDGKIAAEIAKLCAIARRREGNDS